MSRSRVLFERLALATLVGTFVLMMLGGYVKAIGGGLACPDWPKCYHSWYPFVGGAIPPTEDGGFPAWMVGWEWTHRFVASIVGVMILSTAVAAWRLRPVEPRVRFYATAALVLLPIQ